MRQGTCPGIRIGVWAWLTMLGGIAGGWAGAADAPATREMRVWVIWRDRGEEAAFRRFEQEYPGWKIVTSFTLPLTLGSPGAPQQKLLTAIAGGSPPDLLMFDRFSVGEWVMRGALMCQQDMAERSAQVEDAADAVVRAVRDGRPADAIHPLARIQEGFRSFPGCRINQVVDQIRTHLDEGARAESLTPLANELRALCDGIREEEFYGACWKEGSFENRIYTVPMTTDSRALLYNEDLLERAGFVDEQGRARPPRDWEELKDYAVRLTEHDKDGNITQLGFAPNTGNSWLYLFGWLNGGQFMSEDGRTCTLNDPRIVEALTYMRDVYDTLGGYEKVDIFQARPLTGGYDLFTLGKVAMVINCDIALRPICDLEPNFRFGVVPPPPPKGRSSCTWSGGFSWAIPAGAKNPEAAFEFIRFINTERMWRHRAEVNSRFFSSRGRVFIPMMAPLPAINSMMNEMLIANNPNVPPRVRRAFPVFMDIMNISRFRPATPVGQVLWDEHVRAFDKTVRHTYSPTEALERGRQTVQAQLDLAFQDRTVGRVQWGRVTVGCVGFLAVVAGLVYWFSGGKALLRSLAKPESRAALLFASPWLVGLLLFTAGPILVSFLYSFCRYDVLSPAQWVGLKNYAGLLHDKMFWKSLSNTAYMMIGVPVGMGIGLAIALLLNLSVRGLKVYRTLFYLPAIVPLVANAVLWVWVLEPKSGLINSFFRMAGISSPPTWLYSSSWLLGSKAALLLMGLWGAGGGMIIWLAGLKGIPSHLYEAAEIDGAGPMGRFFHVTLPMLTPYIFFNLVMGMIVTMQIFTQAYIMTGGGPDDSTLYFAYYLFRHAFSYFNMGYASAMAWILLVIVCALTLIQLKLSKKWVYYESD